MYAKLISQIFFGADLFTEFHNITYSFDATFIPRLKKYRFFINQNAPIVPQIFIQYFIRSLWCSRMQFIPEIKKLSIKVWHTNQIFRVTFIFHK